MSNISIPKLQLDEFLNPATEQDFVRKIGQAFEEFGFVSIENKYIDYKDIEAFYQSISDFFNLPLEVKKKYEITALAGQRGYTSFGREHAKGSNAPDLKEFWQMGQIIAENHPLKAEYPDNLIVSELPQFNELSQILFKGFEKTGMILLEAIALYLELPRDYFNKFVTDGNSILRAIHYPPITSEPKNAIRAEAHEDINLITLLVGASAEGLQLLSKQGEWLDIQVPQNCIVINVGDMLQRLTNNRLRSTTHRVVNPPREKWHTSRYSIPFFLHPISQMPLNCLDSCVSDKYPIQYEPILAGDYLNERLVEIGLLKK